jgi:putative transposase
MRFCFIEQHVGTFPVRLMCRVLEVSPSDFYAWRGRPESARALGDQQLLADVRRLQSQHQGRYGSPRMHAALRAEGRGCSRGRVCAATALMAGERHERWPVGSGRREGVARP